MFSLSQENGAFFDECSGRQGGGLLPSNVLSKIRQMDNLRSMFDDLSYTYWSLLYR